MNEAMHIGVFDSGLGGLHILRALTKRLPGYSYIYLGDTQRVPYGNRSQETIYQFTREAVAYLFAQECQLVILACNTASTQALRRLQQEYLPLHYPDRRILGVIIPTVEVLAEGKEVRRVGVLATSATVASQAFVREGKKVLPHARFKQQAAPLLVSLLENGGARWIDPILQSYLKPLRAYKIDALILGCTHYPLLKRQIAAFVGKKIRIISQTELLPAKLANYLNRHPELAMRLERRPVVRLCVTEKTATYEKLAKKWFKDRAVLQQVELLPAPSSMIRSHKRPKNSAGLF